MDTLPASYFHDGGQILSAVPVEEYIEAAENHTNALMPSLTKELKKTGENGVNSKRNYTKKEKAPAPKKPRKAAAGGKDSPQNGAGLTSAKSTTAKGIKSQKRGRKPAVNPALLPSPQESESNSSESSVASDFELSTDHSDFLHSSEESDPGIQFDKAEAIMARLRAAVGRQRRRTVRRRRRRLGRKRKGGFPRKRRPSKSRRRRYY